MKKGYLSEYFEGVAAKRLSAVEVDTSVSHQHEFHGGKPIRELLGEPEGHVKYRVKMMYLNDQTDDLIVEDSTLTWYDAREKRRLEGVIRWEYRLYFKTTVVSLKATVGDLLVIAKLRDGSLLAIIAERESSIASQIEWLFGFTDFPKQGFAGKSDLDFEQNRIQFASRYILENIGIAVESSDENYLDRMLSEFEGQFPSTSDFSAYARSTLSDVDARSEPDLALLAWMEREEILFRTLEHYLIKDRISKGFAGEGSAGVDVDGFLDFSLSVQNRRKSRAGLALENHVEQLFKENELDYERGARTENSTKPDFLFPSKAKYDDLDFDSWKLTMLGVKSTCKDRWRQVLAEAERIDYKHLLTLQPAISKSQTKEMVSNRLQLVLPSKLHETFTNQQQEWLMDIKGFIDMVRVRQTS